MRLVPREIDKLQIFTAARIAERRLNDGVKLNHPEAVAYITDFALERIRRGDSVPEIREKSQHVLTEDDVMPGVAGMISMLEVEGTFPDGTKLVSIHTPILPKSASEDKIKDLEKENQPKAQQQVGGLPRKPTDEEVQRIMGDMVEETPPQPPRGKKGGKKG